MQKQLFLLLIVTSTLFAGWEAPWWSQKSDVMIGLSTNPENPSDGKNSLLIIGYSKQFNCNPVVSLLIMNGEKIGRAIKQKTFKGKKDQLRVNINGKIFTGETKMTEYASGSYEFAMMGKQEMINLLNKFNGPLSVTIGNGGKILNFSKTYGFFDANKDAIKNCY